MNCSSLSKKKKEKKKKKKPSISSSAVPETASSQAHRQTSNELQKRNNHRVLPPARRGQWLANPNPSPAFCTAAQSLFTKKPDHKPLPPEPELSQTMA